MPKKHVITINLLLQNKQKDLRMIQDTKQQHKSGLEKLRNEMKEPRKEFEIK